jgi:hypothetical protein
MLPMTASQSLAYPEFSTLPKSVIPQAYRKLLRTASDAGSSGGVILRRDVIANIAVYSRAAGACRDVDRGRARELSRRRAPSSSSR